jgi:hypothetical protein
MMSLHRSRATMVAAATVLALVLPAVLEAQRSPGRGSRPAARPSDPKVLVAASDSLVRGAGKGGTPASTALAPTAVPSFSHFSAAIDAAAANSSRLVRLIALKPAQITLVDMRNVLRFSDEQKRLDELVAARTRQLADMRATLQNSLPLRDLLYQRELSMTQVLAVDVMPDGRAIVYYRAE